MALLNKFNSYIGTRDGRTSAGIVALTGAMMALFACVTFVNPIGSAYRIDFKGARWIQMTGATKWDAAYFRKTLYISEPIVRAWIAISATGNYSIFVNNILVGQDEFPGVRPTGIVDIKKILTPGKNVIAVYVAPGSYPSPPQLLVHGLYQVANSPADAIDSNTNWKVAAIPDGIVGSYSWRSPTLDDRLWANAIEGQSEEIFSTVQPVAIEPLIFALRSDAKWITGRSGDLRHLAFESELKIPQGRTQTWIQIAGSGAYDAVINGHLAISQPVATQGAVLAPMPVVASSPDAGGTVALRTAASVTPPDARAGFPDGAGNESQTDVVTSPNSTLPGFGTPMAVGAAVTRRVAWDPGLVSSQDLAKASAAASDGSTGWFNDVVDITAATAPPSPQRAAMPSLLGVGAATPVLLAYNVSEWLSSGINSIAVSVRSVNSPAFLLLEGFTVSDRGGLVSSFQTDASWMVSSYSKAGSGSTGAYDDAVVAGAAEESPWGPLPQSMAYPQVLPGQDYYRAVRWTVFMIAVTGTVLLFWLAVPMIAHRNCRDLERLWTCDALWHLPSLAALLILCLSCFDVRVPPNWCFVPPVIWSLAGFLGAGKVVVAILGSKASGTSIDQIQKPAPRRYYLEAAALLAIVMVGLAIRAGGLLDASFSHDEAKMAQCSLGVLKVGFPYFQLGSFRRWLTTYELVPYSLALSSLIFGHTVLAYRLPSLIFGTSTIALIGWVGYRMIDWRVGLTGAIIYSFLPIPINWSQDGFYPAQQSFFSLLTFWYFFEVLRTHPLNRRYVILTSIAFMLTYLSWEGSGFILPTLFVTILVLRWGDFDWVRDLHLWRCCLIVTALVIIQLSVRQILLVPDYLGIVYDLSEVTTPGLVFLSRLIFNPLYYIKAFFLAENQILLSVLAAYGLLCFRKEKALLYLCTTLFTLELCYTCFLPRYAPRYDFQATTLLVLAGTGSFFKLYDLVCNLCRRVPGCVSAIGATGHYALLTAFVLAANPFVLKLYRLSVDPANPAYFGRPGVQFKPDYRDIHTYVARVSNPGDAIVSRQAHVFAFFAHKPPDYSPDAILNARMYYDGGLATPQYIDKSWGVPSLRSLDEIKDIRASHARTWLVVAKGCRPGAFMPDARSPQTPPAAASSAMLDFDGEDFAYLESVGKIVREANCQELIALPGVPAEDSAGRSHEATDPNYHLNVSPRLR